ncbi:hypothetical protein FE257_004904 [Aspergillus nanangensis]|uniref:F-box domain-containing protein n=1 Tax=Aspergillus nanangensis TaxID=2582783 RepID=A0AAD4CAJ7_ASPNN|nr:hypothetical protein FE257_004904 [Aspergillus nanangensis]
MPSLLSLPMELLGQIVQETMPVGFEAIALACKTLHAASTPFQAQYAIRTKRFRDFAFSGRLQKNPEDDEESDSGEYWDQTTQETGIRIRNTRELLEHIAADPTVAQYIQCVNLGKVDKLDDEDEDEDEDEANEMPSPRECEISDALRILVHTSPFIQAVGGNPENWIPGIRRSGVDADVFLMTLISQLREVTMHPRWDVLDPFGRRNDERRWQVLKLLTHRANRPDEYPDAPLSLLSVVNSSREPGYEEKVPLTPVVPFLAINSVTEVSLVSCVFKDDGYTGNQFHPTMSRYSANLRTLDLDSCVAGVEELSQVLSRIPNLEVFRFSHETKWHGCGHNQNMGALLATVQDLCADNLRELVVSIVTPWGDPGATLVDMTRFRKLAVLELDVDMLCGPAYDPSMRDLEGDQIEAHDGPAWPRLVDMLPASIERFALNLSTFSDQHLKCVSHLIEGLEHGRASKLPHLEKLSLSVTGSNPVIPDEAREALTAAKKSGFDILKWGTSTHLL